MQELVSQGLEVGRGTPQFPTPPNNESVPFPSADLQRLPSHRSEVERMPSQPAALSPQPLSADLSTPSLHTGDVAASAGYQARGHRAPPVMTKFSCIVEVPVADIPPKDFVIGFLSMDVAAAHALLVPAGSAILESDKGGSSCRVGIFRTPQQWVSEASNKIFPVDSFAGIPVDTKGAVEKILGLTVHERMKFRLGQVQKLKQIVHECQAEQSEILSNMHPEVKNVMEPMQIAAIRKLAVMLGLPDVYFLEGLAQ
eukprot:6492459-Amphidinium_carterae.2